MFPLRKVPRIHGRRLRAVFRRSIELPVSVEGPRLRLVWDWPSGSRRAETSVSRTARFFAHARRSGPKSQRQRLRYQRRGRERSEEHTSELQSLTNLVCRLLLEKKK